MGTYARSRAVGALRQGEILTDFTQYQLDVGRLRNGEVLVEAIKHPYVIVLSQDCDLDQDYRRRLDGKDDNLLASVIFCALTPADQDYRRGIGLDSKEWKRFRQNQDPRLHYLREVPLADDAAGQGLPELAIDFRQCFSVATVEAYFLIESALRRCRLEQPYAEHLNNRFSWHISRVALPVDHHLPLPTQTAVADAETPVLSDHASPPPDLELAAAGPFGTQRTPMTAASPSDSVETALGPEQSGAQQSGVTGREPPDLAASDDASLSTAPEG